MHSESWVFGSSETKQPKASGGLHPQTPASETHYGINSNSKTYYPQNKC